MAEINIQKQLDCNKMTIEQQYLNLLQDILDNGVTKADRTLTGTKSVFGRTLRHNMKDGFPLLTTKKLSFHNIKHELIWFLSGDTNIQYLLQNNVHIWTADAYRVFKKNFESDVRHSTDKLLSLEEFEQRIMSDHSFAETYGSLGPSYGYQWRSFTNYIGYDEPIDQIENLIGDLKSNPDSRRLIVTAWNPAETAYVTLPPCHHMFQCWTRELTVDERLNLVLQKVQQTRPEITMDMVMNDFNIEMMKLDSLSDIITDTDRHNEIEYLFGDLNIPKRELSLMWNQRSVDTFLGLPYNIASYALLLQMLADEVNMVAGELIGSLADTHIYLNHIDQVNEQISRMPLPLPKLKSTKGIESTDKDLQVLGYSYHPAIKAPLSVG